MAAKKTAPKAKAAGQKPAAKAAPAAAPALKLTTESSTREEVQQSLVNPQKQVVLRDWAASMNKEHNVVAMANDAPNVYAVRRPTGIMHLDIDIGGGFPAGGMSIVSGPDNAGKTMLIKKAMAMHQRLYGMNSVLGFAPVEGAFDYKRALDLGMVIEIPDIIIDHWNQINATIGLPSYTREQIMFFKRKVGEFIILRGSTGEETMNTVLEAVKLNQFGIIGVDSFSILLSRHDEAKDVGETPMRAGNANLMTDFLKKYTPHTTGIFGPNYTSLIGVMQVRANADKAQASTFMQKFIKDWKPTGAYATRHGKLVDLQVWEGAKIERTVHSQKIIVGKVVNWKVEKGKAGCHDNASGQFDFIYDMPGGTNDIESIIICGVRQGVFVEENKKVQVYNPITRERTNLGGFANYQEFGRVMATDFDFEHQMRLYVTAGAGLQCLYRPQQ